MNANWLHLWGATDPDDRLDRVSEVTFDPVSGHVFSGGLAGVSMSRFGYMVRYRISLTGPPTPPESPGDGAGAMDLAQFSMTSGTIYVVAVAFDTVGELLPSVPVEATYTKP